MIKKLSFKFVLVFLVLVVSIFITSSCYASMSDIVGTCDAPFSMDDVYAHISSLGFSKDNSIVLVLTAYEENSYFIKVISTANGATSLKQKFNLTHTTCTLYAGDTVCTASDYVTFTYNNGIGFMDIADISVLNGNLILGIGDTDGEPPLQVVNFSNVILIDYDGNVIYEPNQLSVDVTHEFQSDTSAKVNFAINNAPDGAILKYSLAGVEISTDLTAPLELKNPVTYSPRSNKFNC